MSSVKRFRLGFTLVELLVVIAIVGILVGMLLPAISAVRESARRSQCMNNLRQMSIACQNFESTQGFIPPAARLGEGTGWHAYILPYIEYPQLYDQIELTDPEQDFEWASDGERVLETILPIFKCPSDPAPAIVLSQLSGVVNGLVRRGVCSYLACASGTVPSNSSNLRSSRLELKIAELGNASAENLVRAMRSGAMAPTQAFIDHSTLIAPYPEFSTRVEFSDILDGSSNTILLGEGVFDTTRHANDSGTAFRSVGVDHWYIGSGDMDISEFSEATVNPVRDFSEFMATTALSFNFYHQQRRRLNYDGLEDSQFRDQLSYSFNSWHSGNGLNFALADGSSQWIGDAIDDDVRTRLGMIADRQAIGDF